jgi:hypothetical protein
MSAPAAKARALPYKMATRAAGEAVKRAMD